MGYGPTRSAGEVGVSLPVVYLPDGVGKQLRRGHPWVYRDRLPKKLDLSSGTWVQVRFGKSSAYGLWDARSPIAIRLFSQERTPDARWIRDRVQYAWHGRSALRELKGASRTTAYRWLYGEGDGIPGLVADLYGDYAVIETYARSLDVLLEWVVDGLRSCTELKGILLRKGGTRVLWGRSPPRDLVVQEHGIKLYVDLFAGQKTGLYLDHRENRRSLERWCGDRRILNCFAYTGAFSLYALRGGATSVVGIDISPQLGKVTRQNLALNGFAAGKHSFVTADCFELLNRYADQKRRFDMVILDPPPLARSKKSHHAALRAYGRLNQAAIRCLPPGGLLATASCTARVSPSAFRELLGDAAAKTRRRLNMLHEAGHPLDHPVPAHFPEGRYLKFVLGRVGEIA